MPGAGNYSTDDEKVVGQTIARALTPLHVLSAEEAKALASTAEQWSTELNQAVENIMNKYT